MQKGLILLFLLFLFSTVKSQQTIIFSQYFVNDIIYNPAICGSKEYNEFVIQTRQQWLGFEGAPLSANVSYHGALNNRSGMGGYIEYDRTSPSNQSNVQINYAYHVPLNSEDMYISFGVGAKAMYYYLDFLQEDLPPGTDPAYSANAFESFLADASSGVYLYGNNFHIGYSIANMLESSFNMESGEGFSRNQQEKVYYGMAGYMIRVNKDVYLEPSVLIRNLKNQHTEYNLSCRVLYSDQIWSGFSVRSNSSASFFVGTNSSNMQLAYSFDHYFGEISRYQNGTHEITISFRMPNYNKY